jgi:hypothetical protein
MPVYVFATSVVFLVAGSAPTTAYIDPGAGSLILQGLAASLISVGLFWRRVVAKVKKTGSPKSMVCREKIRIRVEQWYGLPEFQCRPLRKGWTRHHRTSMSKAQLGKSLVSLFSQARGLRLARYELFAGARWG